MADGSHDYGTSDDDDGASQEETPFKEALQEILGRIADALADGSQ
jgi:hypothetical protein